MSEIGKSITQGINEAVIIAPYVARIAELERRLTEAVEFIVGYPLDNSAVFIRKCFGSGPDGDQIMWRVASSATVLNRAGKWEYEPQPSSRDDEFFQRCRFETYHEAKLAAEAALAALLARKERG